MARAAAQRPKAGGMGKRKKTFVDRTDTALSLAALIGEAQEDKSRARAQKHGSQATDLGTSDTANSVEAGNSAAGGVRAWDAKKGKGKSTGKRNPYARTRHSPKVKAAKAAIIANEAKTKREKAKMRKEKRKSGSGVADGEDDGVGGQAGAVEGEKVKLDGKAEAKPRKRVAFA